MNLIEKWKLLVDECVNPAEYPFPGEWISLGKGYPVRGIGGWETPIIAHEIAEYDVERAKHLMVLYINCCLREDGMLAARVIAKSDPIYELTEKGRIYRYSHSPIWLFVAKKILDKKWDEKFALFCLESGLKNLKWWEENRKDRIGLFWYMDSFPDEKDSPESGYENSPRWDFTELGPFPCIDLSCQILFYLENLIFLAVTLNKRDVEIKLKVSHDELKRIMLRYFWDEITGIFCDYELTGINTKKTTASFWSIVSGLALDEDIERMVPLLQDSSEFGAPMGLPAVSLSEPKFELDSWRGCLFPSEVFWISLGLQRYKLYDIAASIAQKCLENISRVYKNTGRFWEFYNPLNGDISRLKRKKTSNGPFPDCLGSVPVISLEKIIAGEKIC
ncbi:MAG: alpha,alpha-trehalase [bacterium]|nr:alpha,alpha-trehalase [bacterium]